MQASLASPRPRYVVPGAWMSGLLLAVILLTLAVSLRAAAWTDGLGLLAPIVMGAFLLGMAVSFSRWDGLFPVVHSLVIGLVWVLIWISRAPQIPEQLAGPERIAFIGQSLYQWLLLLFSDQPARSNLVFLLELSLLLWWLGYLAAWAVFREGRVWRAIVPVGLVMLVNMYYGPPTLRFYFAIYTVCALLLAVRSHLADQEIEWRRFRVRYAADIQFDFLRDGLIFAVLVMIIALFAPSLISYDAVNPALEPLRQPWERVQREWGRLFSSLNYQASGSRPAFGNTLVLGGPRNLGDTVIMDVRADSGRYWRAVTFDTYTGNRWLNTSQFSQAIDFGTHVNTPEFAARREVTQTITTYYPAGGVLFAAPQPLRVSLKAQAELAIIEPQGEEESPIAEVTMMRRRGAELQPGETYLVVSALSSAYVEDLREAGTDYPDWVTSTYLDVPPTVSPRVAILAREITAGAETPYDKLVAIEQYLRGFTYDDKIPAPPPGVDGVDYFLFDIQAGYCDYYASSFAIMARSLGIPARVSAGYNQGEWIPEIQAYRVREFNGHSWPEAFFPGYGWIEFEPTAAEEQITRTNRPQEAPPRPTPTRNFPDQMDDEDRFGQEPEQREDSQPPAPTDSSQDDIGLTWLAGLGAMFLVVVLAAFFLIKPSASRGRRRALLDPEFPIKLYGRLVYWAARLGLPVLPSQTPNEHAAVLAGAVPDGRSAIFSITDLYVQEQYSPHIPAEREAENALIAWATLRPQLRREWLAKRLGPVGRALRRQSRKRAADA